MSLHPVILAGGSGTRLWPLSREFYPKPFLSVSGGRSMLQDTILRLDGIGDLEKPLVVCNEEHRFLVAEHSRQIGRLPRSIVLEPVGRNTAPALTLAALAVCEHTDDGPDGVILALPADHVIGEVEAFQIAVGVAARLAESGDIVTFGITPTFPSTGYGYIRRGREVSRKEMGGRGSGSLAFELEEFVEKPDEETARAMLATEEFLWNSGMFVMRASAWLEEIERFRPDIADACRVAYAAGSHDGLFFRPEEEAFAACPADTIDYAVMERISGNGHGGSSGKRGALVAPIEAGWSDVGSWAAIMDVNEKDEDGNVARGDVYTHEMRNSMIFGHHRLVAAVGLENVIVVETADAVLAADRRRVEDVRALVERLKADGRAEQEIHRRVHRPWGWYETIDSGDRFQVKKLVVNPGQALSLQMHHHRSEHWVVVSGTAKIVKDGGESLLFENQSAYVKVGETHRLENPGTIPLEIIEVQSGSYLGEDDIVRFEDRYNRK